MEAFDCHQVSTLPDDYYGRVRAASSWVNAENNWRRRILVFLPTAGVVDKTCTNKLIFASRWEFTVDLNPSLWRILAIFRNDLLIYLFVRVFYCA